MGLRARGKHWRVESEIRKPACANTTNSLPKKKSSGKCLALVAEELQRPIKKRKESIKIF
jgi:hypothetical protein